jgi:hypothetical protein
VDLILVLARKVLGLVHEAFEVWHSRVPPCFL